MSDLATSPVTAEVSEPDDQLIHLWCLACKYVPCGTPLLYISVEPDDDGPMCATCEAWTHEPCPFCEPPEPS